MTLHDNWRLLLRKSWAIKWIALAVLLDIAGVVLPMFIEALDRATFSWLSMAAALGAIWARLLSQKKDGL